MLTCTPQNYQGHQKQGKSEEQSQSRGTCVSLVTQWCLQGFVAPWSRALQAPPSMEFSRKEYWSGQPFATPGDLPNGRTEPVSLVSPTLEDRSFTTTPPGKPQEELKEMIITGNIASRQDLGTQKRHRVKVKD